MKKVIRLLGVLLLGISIGMFFVARVSVCELDPAAGTSLNGDCVWMSFDAMIVFIVAALILAVQGLICFIQKKR